MVRSFVRGGRLFICTDLQTYIVPYCSTDLMYLCGCAVNEKKYKADQGHKEGHAPRGIFGIPRPRTEVLGRRA